MKGGYGIELMDWEKLPVAQALVVAWRTRRIASARWPITSTSSRLGSFVDVKSAFDDAAATGGCLV